MAQSWHMVFLKTRNPAKSRLTDLRFETYTLSEIFKSNFIYETEYHIVFYKTHFLLFNRGQKLVYF